MTSVTATADLPVPPDVVWELIGGFGSLPNWIPSVSQSELGDGGRVRYLTASSGQRFVERLKKYDSGDRSYSYSIVESSLPVTDYLATLRVTAVNGGNGSYVEWSARFTPDGVSEEEAEGIFATINTRGKSFSDIQDELSKLTGQRTLDAAIDCVGAEETIQTSIGLLSTAGAFVSVGLVGTKIDIPLFPFTAREITYHGSFWANYSDLQEVLALAQKGKIQHSIKRVKFEDINENVELLRLQYNSPNIP